MKGSTISSNESSGKSNSMTIAPTGMDQQQTYRRWALCRRRRRRRAFLCMWRWRRYLSCTNKGKISEYPSWFQ